MSRIQAERAQSWRAFFEARDGRPSLARGRHGLGGLHGRGHALALGRCSSPDRRRIAKTRLQPRWTTWARHRARSSFGATPADGKRGSMVMWVDNGELASSTAVRPDRIGFGNRRPIWRASLSISSPGTDGSWISHRYPEESPAVGRGAAHEYPQAPGSGSSDGGLDGPRHGAPDRAARPTPPSAPKAFRNYRATAG